VLTRDVWEPRARIYLDALRGNRAALEFWRALGFVDYSVRMELRR
jgi:hypothetical protein